MTSLNLNQQIQQLGSERAFGVNQEGNEQFRKDQCWFRTLAYAIVFLIGEGICLLYRGNIHERENEFSGQNYMVAYFFQLTPIIVALIFLSILIATSLTLLIQSRPAFTVYLVFILNTTIFVICIILGVYFDLPWFLAVLAAAMLIFTGVAITKFQSLKRGIHLAQGVKGMLGKNKRVYVFTFFSLGASLALITGHFYGILGAFAYKGKQGTYFAFELLLHSYYFLGLALNICIYYSLLFCFTQIYKGEISVNRILSKMLSRIGSIFRASLTLIITASFKKILSGPNCIEKDRQGLLSKFVSWYYCVSKDERMRVFCMDHNAIIGMSLFDTQYSQSVEKMIDLTSCGRRHYQQIFKSVECFTDFIGLQFQFLSLSIPALIGIYFGYQYNLNVRKQNPHDAFRDSLVVAGIIIVISAFLVNMILTIVPSCMSNAFTMFCMAEKQMHGEFKSKQIYTLSDDFRRLFQELQPETRFSDIGPKEMKRVKEDNPENQAVKQHD